MYLAVMWMAHLLWCVPYYWVFILTQKGSLGESRRLALFWILLFFVAVIFNGVWSCSVWGRLYDSTDYVCDFSPFWPITQGVIDAPWGNDHGHLLGIKLWQLNLVWLVFAAGTWMTTIWLYRMICRRWSFAPKNSTPSQSLCPT
jgi:hypothetical protein